jgi:hypothetical protein
MRYVLGLAAVVAAIILGPIATDAIRGDGKSDLDRSVEELRDSVDRLESLSR